MDLPSLAEIQAYLQNAKDQYMQSDVPAARMMRGEPANYGEALGNALQASSQDPMAFVGSIKSVKTPFEIAHDIAQKNAVDMLGLHPENTAMDRAKALGFDVDNPVYHGTTHNFSQFNKKNINPESYMGSGYYFTSNPKDASINYAGLGPDLTYRLQRKTEEILSNKNIDNWWTAFEQAKKQIVGESEGHIIPSFIKSKLTLDVSPNTKDYIDFTPTYNHLGDIISDSPNSYKLYQSLIKEGKKYGFNGEKAFHELGGSPLEVMYGDELDKLLRNNSHIQEAIHPKTGDLMDHEVINNIYKNFGYDTFKMNASNEFPKMFENIPENVTHVIATKPSQIRSKFAAFDPAEMESSDLLKAHGGLVYLR